MARKKVTIDKWYGGMSNDPSIGWVGSFYDGRWVEIRKNSRKVKLSSNYPVEQLANSRANWYVIWAIIPSNTTWVYGTYDWRIENIITGWELAYPIMVWNGNFGNIFSYSGTSEFWVAVATNGIYRWILDNNDSNLWLLTSSSIVTNWDFSSATGWTVWSGWTISWGTANHIAWFNAALDQFITIETSTLYVVQTRATVSSGSFSVSIWGILWTYTTSESGRYVAFHYTSALSTSETLAIIPSTDFVWSIEEIIVKKSNATLHITKTFNWDAVTLSIPNFLYIGNGQILTKVDTSLSNWSTTDPVKIAQGYIIKWLSKVWDQIYIYASNWIHGKQYIWDGSSATPSREIDWYDKPIQRVINYNNIDYIIVKTTLRSSLYLVNGYQPELIFQSLNIQTAWKDRFAFDSTTTNAWEIIGSRILIPVSWGVFSYGNISPWYPLAWVKEYTVNGNSPTALYYTESNAYYLYIFYTSSKTGSSKNYICKMFQREESSGNDYSIVDPWYIQSHPFIGTGYSQRKSSATYKIGAVIPTNTQINIYTRCDDELWFATFYVDADYNGMTILPIAWDTYSNSGNTYIITEVTTTLSSPKWAILHCTYTWTGNVAYSWTLTRVSGSWDSSIVFFRSNEFKKIKTIINNEKWGQLFKYNESYNKIEWIVELQTKDQTKTPELYDFQAIFDETEIDS